MSPAASGRACRIEFQNASTVCPDRVRPEASVIVPETMTGRRRPSASKADSSAKIAGLRVQGVEHRLDEEEIDAARDEGARRLLVGAAKLVEARVAGAGVLHLGRDGRGAVGGPQHPGREPGAVRPGPGGGPRPRDAGAGLVDLGREIGRAVVALRDRGGGERVGEDHVRPGREVRVMDLRHHVGPGEAQEVVVAAKGAVVGPEALPAVVRLVEAALLEHGPGGAVEDDDALTHRGAQTLVTPLGHVSERASAAVPERRRRMGAVLALARTTGWTGGPPVRAGIVPGGGRRRARPSPSNRIRDFFEGDPEPGSRRSCNPLQRPGGGMSLAALQPGDDRLRRLHPDGELGLGQPGLGSGRDQGPGQLELRTHLVVALPVVGVAAPLLVQFFEIVHFISR